jgi:lipoprotein-releasing system ATP-binding protein
MVRVRSLKKDYPVRRSDASLWARGWGFALGWTGLLDDWRRLNDGLTVLRGVDLDVKEGETLAIVGPSGAGKSTLLHLIGMLDRPTDGAVLYRSQNLETLGPRELNDYRNRKVGFVFQFYYLLPDLSALENVLVPAMVQRSVFGWPRARTALRDRARELLRSVRLEDRARHKPSQLSGGEQQRVAIARALLLEPEILLCDEPTGNLDRRTGDEVLDLLFQLKREKGQTTIIVTHDARIAARADRTIELVDGRVKRPGEPSGLGPVDPPAS